jgi:hypothetical protein
MRNKQGKAEKVDLPAEINTPGLLEPEKKDSPHQLENSKTYQGSHCKKGNIPPPCEEDPDAEETEKKEKALLTDPHEGASFRFPRAS